ncbi:MAG: TIGR02757 family protein [Saprospiraceae bacterium]|nr:TIGR02757 family protein [Saprospiraceae bacterium]
MTDSQLKSFLDLKVKKYNIPGFIPLDPISIPHKYSIYQDIEITGFWTSILAWGQRVTIVNKANELFALMDNAPYDFILNHTESDRQKFESFKHRTFNFTDTLYFLEFLQNHYSNFSSLEDAFLEKGAFTSVESSLIHFRNYFFDHPFAPDRTRKHIASPARKSTCKRLNMFLRWMVRKDDNGVDFGIWNKIPQSALMMPLDVHVERHGRNLGLLSRKQRDWQAVKELTNNLRKFDANDPVKYDFALFGMGVDSKI